MTSKKESSEGAKSRFNIPNSTDTKDYNAIVARVIERFSIHEKHLAGYIVDYLAAQQLTGIMCRGCLLCGTRLRTAIGYQVSGSKTTQGT